MIEKSEICGIDGIGGEYRGGAGEDWIVTTEMVLCPLVMPGAKPFPISPFRAER